MRRLSASVVVPALAASLAMVFGSVPVSAQPIPERPEHLKFPTSTFEPPPVAGLRFELRNGLPVYLVSDRDLPLVDVVLALPVGDRDEGPGEDGLASMTAFMARRGGAGDLGPEPLDDEIDALGARLETSSSWGRTVLALDTGSEALDRGLELLASVVFEPRFDEDRLTQAKENLRVSLRAAADDPRTVLDRAWLRLVHGPESPRARRLTEASAAAFDRGALVRFHRRHWTSEGAVIAVSGAVDAESLVSRLDELFGGWEVPAGDSAAGAAANVDSGAGTPGSSSAAVAGVDAPGRGRGAGSARREEDADRVNLDRRATKSGGTDGRSTAARPSPRTVDVAAALPGWWTIDRRGPQAAVAVGHRGAVFDSWDAPDRWALLLLTEILDGPGAVSRLRSRLQLEQGVTYRVLTTFDLDVAPAGSASPGHRPAGEFRIFLETAPESAAVAAAVVLDELRRLRRDDVPAAEIAAARQSLLSRLPLLFDRAESIAGRYAEDELLGRPHEYWSRYRQRLGAVTAAGIRRAARRFIDPEGLVLLVVGDAAEVRAGQGADRLRRAVGPPRPVAPGPLPR